MADARNIAAYSTLASGITAAASSLSAASGEGARFPSSGSWVLNVYDSRYPNFAVAYQNGAGEAMQITSRSTDTLTIGTRAYLDPQSKGAKAFNTTGVTYRIEMNQMDASETASGDVNTTTQSFGGFKTFVAHAGSGKDSTTTGKYRFYTAGGSEYGEITTTSPLSSNRTWTMPDKSMTVAGVGDTTIPFSGGASTLGSGTTNYITPSAGALYSTTGDQRFYFRVAGTLANLHVWGTGNANITGLVFTMMKGTGTGASSATSQTVTIDPNGGFVYGSDTTNTVTVAANDWIELRVVNSGGGFAASGIGATVEFTRS